MTETVNPNFLLPDTTPADIPGLISFWDFKHSGEVFSAAQGEAYVLQSQSGVLNVVADAQAPLGGSALRLSEGQWLSVARSDCPRLDRHGPDGHFTLLAWVKRQQKSNRECEFIAGQWNETHKSRQYAMFINIGVWQQPDQLTGHISHVGGPTPGYKYCIDGAVGATPIACDEWQMLAVGYDGQASYAWINGMLDLRPGLNPYVLPGGLNDGGPSGSDFTVGAVDRSGVIGNFFVGQIAGLAVYERVLGPAELCALAAL